MISLIGLVLLFLGLWVFFLPTILAKGRSQEDKVTLLNVFWGATGVGWLLSLVWALYQRGQLPSAIVSLIEKIDRNSLVLRKWLYIFAGFVFLLIHDFKLHRGFKKFFDLSFFAHPEKCFWNILSLNWMPISIQFLLLLAVAALIVGLKSMVNKTVLILTGTFALVLFSLSYIEPFPIEYALILWGSCLLFSFSAKE